MSTHRLFISSVQKEFQAERRAIKDFVEGNALLRRFFDVFLFEDLPASDRKTDDVYLEEVGRCTIYLGIFGRQYSAKDDGSLEWRLLTEHCLFQAFHIAINILIQQFEEQAEVLRVTLVRRGGHQEIMVGHP